MADATTLSYINMFGVLAALEDLCRTDEDARAIIAGLKISVTFAVKDGPTGTLYFDDGTCHMVEGARDGDIRLWLSCPEKFNAMVAGEANPIPTRGFLKLGFMIGPFDKLTKRLEAVMMADEEALAVPEFRAKHTELLMHVAAGALAQVAAHDAELRQWAKAMPEGIVGFEIENGPAVQLVETAKGLAMQRGRAETPRARMAFVDIDTAYRLLSGKTDSFSVIAAEKMKLAGFIPMLDVLDKLLIRTGQYLA